MRVLVRFSREQKLNECRTQKFLKLASSFSDSSSLLLLLAVFLAGSDWRLVESTRSGTLSISGAIECFFILEREYA